MQTSFGAVTEQAPVLYQLKGGLRQAVAGSFVVHGDQVSFHVGAYNASVPLDIDPVLSYATYFPGRPTNWALRHGPGRLGQYLPDGGG